MPLYRAAYDTVLAGRVSAVTINANDAKQRAEANRDDVERPSRWWTLGRIYALAFVAWVLTRCSCSSTRARGHG